MFIFKVCLTILGHYALKGYVPCESSEVTSYKIGIFIPKLTIGDSRRTVSQNSSNELFSLQKLYLELLCLILE